MDLDFERIIGNLYLQLVAKDAQLQEAVSIIEQLKEAANEPGTKKG